MNGGRSRREDVPRYYGGSGGGNYSWRRRRPTPFVIAVIIFAIVLLAVIFTSRAFRSFISGDGIAATTGGTTTYVTYGGESAEGDPTVTQPQL